VEGTPPPGALGASGSHQQPPGQVAVVDWNDGTHMVVPPPPNRGRTEPDVEAHPGALAANAKLRANEAKNNIKKKLQKFITEEEEKIAIGEANLHKLSLKSRKRKVTVDFIKRLRAGIVRRQEEANNQIKAINAAHSQN